MHAKWQCTGSVKNHKAIQCHHFMQLMGLWLSHSDWGCDFSESNNLSFAGTSSYVDEVSILCKYTHAQSHTLNQCSMNSQLQQILSSWLTVILNPSAPTPPPWAEPGQTHCSGGVRPLSPMIPPIMSFLPCPNLITLSTTPVIHSSASSSASS